MPRTFIITMHNTNLDEFPHIARKFSTYDRLYWIHVSRAKLASVKYHISVGTATRTGGEHLP